MRLRLGVALLAFAACTPAYSLRGPPALVPGDWRADLAGGQLSTSGPPAMFTGTFEATRGKDVHGEPGAVRHQAQWFGRLNMGETFFPEVVQRYYFAFDPRIGLRWLLEVGPTRFAIEASACPDLMLFGNALLLGLTGAAGASAGVRFGRVDVFGAGEAAAQWLRVADPVMGGFTEWDRTLFSAFAGVAIDLGVVAPFAVFGPSWNNSVAYRRSDVGPVNSSQVPDPFSWVGGIGVRIQGGTPEGRPFQSRTR